MVQTIFILIIAFIIAEFIFSRWLEWLNDKSWTDKIPAELEGLYDAEKYAKARAYDREKGRLGLVSGSLSFVLILGMLLFHGFALIDDWARTIAENETQVSLLFFAVLFIASDIIGLPFSIYGIFVIEEKYGFNKMTWRTFIADKIKSYLLAIILGGGLITLIIWFWNNTGEYFWLYAWVSLTVFTLFMSMFYTSTIMKLFNKFSPLPDGDLKTAINEYAARIKFPLNNIKVMDGSKRSSKANAFFTGLFGRKNIVLYDTLIEKNSTEELVAVLAHEVGHYKKKHVQQGMIISVLYSGALLFLFGWLAKSHLLYEVLGASQPGFHLAILTFSILYSPVSFVLGIAMNKLSRKNEYQADRFAKETYHAEPLISALKKLSVDHLSNLSPHPLYVFFYYSHPTLLQRMRAMKSDLKM